MVSSNLTSDANETSEFSDFEHYKDSQFIIFFNRFFSALLAGFFLLFQAEFKSRYYFSKKIGLRSGSHVGTILKDLVWMISSTNFEPSRLVQIGIMNQLAKVSKITSYTREIIDGFKESFRIGPTWVRQRLKYFKLWFQSWIFRLQFCLDIKRFVGMVSIWSPKIGQFHNSSTLQGFKNLTSYDYGANNLKDQKFCIWLDNSCIVVCWFGNVYGFKRYYHWQQRIWKYYLWYSLPNSIRHFRIVFAKYQNFEFLVISSEFFKSVMM